MTDRYASLNTAEKALIAILALAREMPGKGRLVNYLRDAGIKSPGGSSYTPTTLEAVLSDLKRQGWVVQTPSGDLSCLPSLQATALQDAAASGILRRLGGTFRNAMRMLRIAMLLGWEPDRVRKRLVLCADHPDFYHLHPYLVICGRPFDAALFALLHPLVQEEVLVELLPDCLAHLAPVEPLNHCAQALLALPIGHHGKCADRAAQRHHRAGVAQRHHLAQGRPGRGHQRV